MTLDRSSDLTGAAGPARPAGPVRPTDGATSPARIRSGMQILSSVPKRFALRDRWREILAVAGGQHGVITAAQLYEAGVSPPTLSTYAEAGLVHRVHQGVYALAGDGLSRSARFHAAVLACGEGAVLSFRSAAAWHGLMTLNYGPTDVTVAARRGRTLEGIRWHSSTTLRPVDIFIEDGIPVTAVPRTLFDLAEVIDERRLQRALDEAIVSTYRGSDGAARTAMEIQVAHNAKRQRPAGIWRRLLEDLAASTAGSRNEFEERFLQLIKAAELPLPEVQPWLDLDDGQPLIRPDFLWREQRVIVETDGYREHAKRSRYEHDRDRDQRVVAAGFVPVRVTWRQLHEGPGRVTGRLRATLAGRARK